MIRMLAKLLKIFRVVFFGKPSNLIQPTLVAVDRLRERRELAISIA